MKKMYFLGMLACISLLTSAQTVTETVIGSTQWDLQPINNRSFLYEDGTMATVWTLGTRGDAANPFMNRGTGYNYFDGNMWGQVPTQRIDTSRAAWPSYAPTLDGEIVVAHHNSIGIVVNRRTSVGEGNWISSILSEPAADAELSWPKIVSNGENRTNVHLLTGTFNPYEGMSSAILYYQSLDGGVTWSTEPTIIEGMTSEDYAGFSHEAFSWAEPKGDTLAFVVADTWNDLFIMKSVDNGTTWTKTIVWEHPYPMWDFSDTTEMFFAPDGMASLAFDQDGELHLAFGIMRARANVDTTTNDTVVTRTPFANGIAYWNEGMDAWTGTETDSVLNPGNLEESGNLVAWMQDANNNDTLDFITNGARDFGAYGVGLVSMPQLSIDEDNNIFLVYSGVTEGFDNGTQMFRHIWIRTSIDGGTTWGDFIDLTAEEESENVFPNMPAFSNDSIHIIFQRDDEPGLSQFGGEDEVTDNEIIHMSVPKALLVSTPTIYNPNFKLTQNYPNPFNGVTNFNLSVEKSSRVSINIHDITGRLVMKVAERNYPAGDHVIPVNAQQLKRGLYTYTFLINGEPISNKMIVK